MPYCILSEANNKGTSRYFHIINSSAPSFLYASVNRVGIGSDNGLAPNRRQAII